eukprot:GHVH01012297.1.p1 GENE.GHVH01012297.1~~GHVH01012297.1.p1  ORF type:complete len:109 (+),score=20.30 GHVH01012297.1:94-420(+)
MSVDDENISMENGAIGFLENERRMNVAVTRARHNLILVGNREYLTNARSESGLWYNFISYVSTDGVIIDIKDRVMSYLENRWKRKPLEKDLWNDILSTSTTMGTEATE